MTIVLMAVLLWLVFLVTLWVFGFVEPGIDVTHSGRLKMNVCEKCGILDELQL